MWILKEYTDEEDNVILVDVELEVNETSQWVIEYLKKFYSKATFNIVNVETTYYKHHKVENIYPHVNVMEVNKIKRF